MSVLRQSAIIFVLGWLLAPLQFVTSVIVARAVGPEGKGILALLAGVTVVLTSLATPGIASGAAAIYHQRRFEPRAVVGSAIALTALSAALVLGAYAAAGDAFARLLLSDRDLAGVDPLWIVIAVAAVGPAALSALGDVILVVENAMRVYAWRTAVTGLLGLALTWVLTFQLDMGLTGVLVSQPLSLLCGLGMLAVWMRRQPHLRTLRMSGAAAGAVLRVGVQQYALGVIALIAKRVDIFLIARLLSVEEAGYYAAALLIPQILIGIPRATMWPLVASFAGSSTADPQLLARASRIQVFVLALMTLALLPVASVLVRVMFGDAFAPAAAPLRWALAGVCATPVTISINAFLTARGRPGLSIASAVTGTGVQIALTLLLIRTWGSAGSAAALSANYVTTAAVQLLVVRAERAVSARAMLVPTREDLEHVWAMAAARVRRLRR